MSITHYATLCTLECSECHMPFALTESFMRERKLDHKTFYCPGGHRQYFPGASKLEWAEKERDHMEKCLARERAEHDQTREELRHTEAQRRGEKAAKTRLKKRAAGGACPCCNRTFGDLQQHMRSKHPSFGE